MTAAALPLLYDYLPSGNGYKVRLLFRALEIEHELVLLDLTRGETRTPEFLAMNPNGRVPLVRLADGRYLAESHAILGYFAEGSALVPEDRYERALMHQWMCFEQYSLEPFIGTLRFWRSSLGQMPAGAFFSTIFFVLLSFAAWTSGIGLMEPAVAWLVEHRNRTRAQAAVMVGGARVVARRSGRAGSN